MVDKLVPVLSSKGLALRQTYGTFQFQSDWRNSNLTKDSEPYEEYISWSLRLKTKAEVQLNTG